MTNWNPSAPVLVGPEWMPRSSVGVAAYTSGTEGPGQQVTSTLAETITQIIAGVASSGGAGRLVADVYQGNAIPDHPVTQRDYAPSADAGNSGQWTTFTGSNAGLYATIDEAPDFFPDLSDGVWDTIGSSEYDNWAFRVGSGAFPAARRVVNVQARMRVRGGAVSIGFVRAGNIYGEQSTGFNSASGPGGFRLVELSWGELCPWTGKPWTQTDVVELSNGTTVVRMRRGDRSTGYLTPSVAVFQLRVRDVAENRVAYGLAPVGPPTTPDAAPAPLTFDAYTASTGAAGWAKLAATTYMVVLRVVSGYANVGVALLRSPQPNPLVGNQPHSFTAYQTAEGAPLPNGPTTQHWAHAIAFKTAAGTSVDSQPWSRLTYHVISGSCRQAFTPPAPGGTYGTIAAIIKVPPGSSDSRLRFTVRRSSDDVALASGEIDRRGGLAGLDIGFGLRLVQVPLSVPVALVSTSYYVDMTRVGTDPTPAWQVGLMETPSGAVVDQFGAATLVGYNLGSTAVWQVQVAQLPAALPGAVLVSESTVPMTTPAVPTFDACHDPSTLVPVPWIRWPATTLGATFTAYEVERSDERDRTWRTIARIASSTMLQVYDHEARFGVAARYRVRQMRTDGIGSVYVTSPRFTPTLPDKCKAGMAFTSNLAPSAGVLAPDVYGAKPARSYKFLEADELVLHKIYGRDGFVAFRPLERRGVSFARQVLVDALGGAKHRGESVFDTLLGLVTSRALPYVAVRDSYGDRWLAAVNLDTGTAQNTGAAHLATANMTELTEDPSPATTYNGTLGSLWTPLAGVWGPDNSSPGVSGFAQLFVASASDPGLAVVRTPYEDAGRAGLNLADGAQVGSGLAVKVIDGRNFVTLRLTAVGTMQLQVIRDGVATSVGPAQPWTAAAATSIAWAKVPTGIQFTARVTGQADNVVTVTDPIFDQADYAGLVHVTPGVAPATRYSTFYVQNAAGQFVAIETWKR